jgi:hypothetical protein
MQYLQTDEKEDLISSLKLVQVSADLCQGDVQFWKWVLVGTHSSLQAAIVFHLGFGNDLLVAKPAHAKKWLAAYRGGNDYPDMHMDYFLELFDKAKTQAILGNRLRSTESQDKSVERLLAFRNEFVHFMPKGWSIELAGLPEICIDALRLIEDLAANALSYRWEDEDQAARFSELLSCCFTSLSRLQAQYNAA